jgi:hypothetical protein
MPFTFNVSAPSKEEAKLAAAAELTKTINAEQSLAILRSPATAAIKKLVDMLSDDDRALSVSVGGNVFGETDDLKGASLTVTVGYLS